MEFSLDRVDPLLTEFQRGIAQEYERRRARGETLWISLKCREYCRGMSTYPAMQAALDEIKKRRNSLVV